MCRLAFLLLLSLLILGAAPSQAVVGELPPADECSFNSLLAIALSESQCAQPFISGIGDETCCELADDYFGQESSEVTGNCFCVEDILANAASSGASELETFLRSCNSAFGAKIGYLGAGAGFCPGAPPQEQPTLTDPVIYPDKRSFIGWVRDLGEEPILLWTSILAIPGAIGTLGFMWAGLVSVL